MQPGTRGRTQTQQKRISGGAVGMPRLAGQVGGTAGCMLRNIEGHQRFDAQGIDRLNVELLFIPAVVSQLGGGGAARAAGCAGRDWAGGRAPCFWWLESHTPPRSVGARALRGHTVQRAAGGQIIGAEAEGRACMRVEGAVSGLPCLSCPNGGIPTDGWFKWEI
jgi:hypothetical protein